MLQQTSLEAYWNIKNLPNKRQQVYDCISSFGPICNQQIARRLNKPINEVTGRTRELVLLDLVEEAYKARYFETGKTVIFWRVK